VLQPLDLRLERHDAPGDAEEGDEDARHGGDEQVRREQHAPEAHGIPAGWRPSAAADVTIGTGAGENQTASRDAGRGTGETALI
jgi:hypothetical protein